MKKTDVVTVEDAKEITGLHFTLKHTGKMKGMQSLSTSCLCNSYCEARSNNPDIICSHCYAQRQMKMYKSMEKCFKKNTEILTSMIIQEDILPLINAAYFRFESFGDINNEIQVINYFNLCKKNPNVHFALWTKNPWIIDHVLENGSHIKKPRNLQIILSSTYLNTPDDKARWRFVDKIFTVYDKKYIKEHNVDINCGAKSCLKCHKCYIKGKDVYINEILK